MAERTTVRLPGELLARAKRKAASEGRTLTSIIEDGLRLVVSERGKTTPAGRETLPISSARGWLRPGITLKDIDEQDELQSFHRD